jgi:hydroxyacylglutathione hydrolase
MGCEEHLLAREEAVIFRPFYYYDLGCASYLLGCGTVGRCAVVDPRADDVETHIAFARDKKMQIAQVIDTHVHADHRSGGVALAKVTGAPYRLYESADVRVPFTPMRDGEEIQLGNTRVRVVHTPGHSPESVCLVVTDLKRGTDPWFVLTGDTLFVGAVGRPDLPGQARENAERLYASIHDRLLVLSDDLEVYPGHFSGSLCGAGLSGKPSSTIAFERRWNPMLSLPREAFVAALVDVPDKPAEMERILAANRGTVPPDTTA